MCKSAKEQGGPKRCSADTRARRDKAKQALDEAEASLEQVRATLGAAPWRPESQHWHDEYGIVDPHSSEEFREWEDTVAELADTHGVQVITLRHSEGVWQGGSEPSALLSATADDRSVWCCCKVGAVGRAT
ncbi:hypothetical protein [Corynebacterium sp. H78]|uniref:hypothetical protein n=1 Tax=Corynebacterium sp. H78 TaxID=3133417 RepID=UPI0030A12CB4